jgi:hypothetical protein
MPTAKTLSKTEPKIDARTAAHAAADYFRDLYANVKSFSLEEVELSEDGDYWLITLSFEVGPKTTAGFAIRLEPPKTKFKVFKVNAQTGQVVSMRIRKLE